MVDFASALAAFGFYKKATDVETWRWFSGARAVHGAKRTERDLSEWNEDLNILFFEPSGILALVLEFAKQPMPQKWEDIRARAGQNTANLHAVSVAAGHFHGHRLLGKNPDIPHLIKEVVKAKEDFYRYFDDPNMPSSNWIVFEALRKALKIEKYRSRIITLQDKISAFIDQHHAELHEFQRIHITGKASEGAERSTKTERSDHEEDKEHTSEVTGDAGFRNV